MATKKQKTKVGVFLVGCFTLLVVIVTVVAGLYQQAGLRQWIIFDESVSGLYEGAPVQYQGVPIGKVIDITVDPQNRVKVEINVDPETATLYRGVQAELVIHSVAAGTMAISLSGGDPDEGKLPEDSTIKARASALTAIGTKIEEVLIAVNDLAVTLNEQLRGEEGEEGIMQQAGGLLERARELTDNVEQMIDTATQTLKTADERIALVGDEALELSADIRGFAQNADGLVKDLRGKIEGLDMDDIQAHLARTTANMADISEELKKTAANLETTIINLEHDADNVSYAVRTSLQSLRDTLRSVSVLADQLQQDPASLVRGRGEPR